MLSRKSSSPPSRKTSAGISESDDSFRARTFCLLLVAEKTSDLAGPRLKSFWLAFWLALFFGPFGLLYVSWQRCAVMLLLFLAGFFFIPGETGAVITICLWLIAPAATVIALGTRPRRLRSDTTD